MKFPVGIDMIEATRLTRQGKLKAALALLMQGTVPKTAEVPGELSIDMAAPSQEPGASWSARAPGFSERVTKVVPTLERLMAQLGEYLPGGASRLRKTATPLHAPEGSSFEGHVHSDSTGQRPYKLYIPGVLSDESPALVVMLHGCTQSPDDFASGTQMNALAEIYGFLVAYPGQTQSANASKCWNWFNAGDQQRDRGEAALIADLTREVIRTYRIDPRRVFVAGLSAGGAAAAVLGAIYPDLYVAVGVHSGVACGAARDMTSAFAAMTQGAKGPIRSNPRPLRTIVFHGDADRTVNPVNATQITAQVRGRTQLRRVETTGISAGGVRYTRTIETDKSGVSRLEAWVLHGVGHAWSGGSSGGSYTDPKGPDASAEMVRFFLQVDPEI